MRTVTFQSVYEAIVRRHGLDPTGDAINHDTAAALVEHINNRVNTAFATWPMPELTHTEERAYRQVWNATKQFYRVNAVTGKPDEVFYIPNASYYKVLGSAIGDPPIGTLPTNAGYFTALTPVDTYIAFDQVCKRSIGQVLGIYKSNPRLNGCRPIDLCLAYKPSELGIDVCSPAGPTVFVHYLIPPPKFTTLPYVDGRTYARGERRLWVNDGNTYRCVTAGTNPPSDTSMWALEPFPEVLAQYVKAGAYADSKKESVRGEDAAAAQIRLAQAAASDAEADSALQMEIDALIAQGQRYYYTRPYYYRSGVCVSQPWTGATVSELTDVCDDEVIYPQPIAQPGVIWKYYTREQVGNLAALIALPTVGWLIGSRVELDIPGQPHSWVLKAGAADVTDPGQQAPADYNATANNVHWEAIL